jgi:uncharacterized protein
MMRISILKSAALILALGAVPAGAASINCRGQIAADFRAICNNPQLSQRDDQAAALFDRLINQTDRVGQAALRAERLSFQRDRGACNARRRCMMAAYDDYISALQSMQRRPTPGMARVR